MASDDDFMSERLKFQLMDYCGSMSSNSKIRKRKREEVSDTDSDGSHVSRKSKRSKKRCNGNGLDDSVKQSVVPDVQENGLMDNPTKRAKSNNYVESISIKKSLSDAEDDNTFSQANLKKMKKRKTEQFNGESIFQESLIKKSLTDVEDNESFSQANPKKKKKSKTEQFKGESIFQESLIKKSLTDVEDNDTFNQANPIKKKKSKTEHFNRESIFEESLVKKSLTDVEDNESFSQANTKKKKKSKTEHFNGEHIFEESLIKKSLTDVEDNDTFSQANPKKKKKSKTEHFNGESIFEESLVKKSLTDVEDNESFSQANTKKKKKSKTEHFNREHIFEESLIKKSLSDVEDNDTFSQANPKKKKKSKTEHFNGESINEDFLVKKSLTDVEDNETYSQETKSKKSKKQKSKNDEESQDLTEMRQDESIASFSNSVNHFQAAGKSGQTSTRVSKIQAKPPSVEYVRDIKNVLRKFSDKNETFQQVFSDNSHLSGLSFDSSCFIVQVPIDIDPRELDGKEISLSKNTKIKTSEGKYIAKPLDNEPEPVLVVANNQHVYLTPSHISLEKNCELKNLEPVSPSKVDSLNLIDPDSLIKRNPVLGLETEEYNKVLSPHIENKLKAAEKAYNKYKNKKRKKDDCIEIKKENIKDEEIFQYLSQPSQML